MANDELQAQIDGAADKLYAADNLEWVTSHPTGLWYAPITPDESVYVVAVNGTAIGQIWRGEQQTVLHGWTYAAFGDSERHGPHRTARHAAAAMAQSLGIEVQPGDPGIPVTRT